MDKHWDKKYDDKEYSLKQLDELKHDVRSSLSHAASQLTEIEKVVCGLTTGHQWRLHKFDDTTWPYCEPPGQYIYKCVACGEKICLKADNKKDWEKDFEV